MRAREVVKRLIAEGWYKAREGAEHEVYKHPDKPGHVAIPRHPGDIKPGTLRSIYDQAGWGKP
jgi:predicted RNA binding protein YcfA (HicA-like mRNA interferase family)